MPTALQILSSIKTKTAYKTLPSTLKTSRAETFSSSSRAWTKYQKTLSLNPSSLVFSRASYSLMLPSSSLADHLLQSSSGITKSTGYLDTLKSSASHKRTLLNTQLVYCPLNSSVASKTIYRSIHTSGPSCTFHFML